MLGATLFKANPNWIAKQSKGWNKWRNFFEHWPLWSSLNLFQFWQLEISLRYLQTFPHMIWNQHLFTSLSAFYCFSGSLSKAIKTSYLLQENKGLLLEVDTPQITSCLARVEERVSHRCFYGAFLFHLELGLLKMLMLAVDDAQAHIYYNSSPLLLILSLALLLKTKLVREQCI